MEPKIVNIVLVVVGIFLFLTGILQIMTAPGIFIYLSTLAGALLTIVGLYGLKQGKVY